jgi:hypothetical protein
MSDCEIISLSLTTESTGNDSENYFFGKLKSTYSADFPNLIGRSNFNRRRKRLRCKIDDLNQTMADFLNEGENAYSILVTICQIVHEKRSKICRE